MSGTTYLQIIHVPIYDYELHKNLSLLRLFINHNDYQQFTINISKRLLLRKLLRQIKSS